MVFSESFSHSESFRVIRAARLQAEDAEGDDGAHGDGRARHQRPHVELQAHLTSILYIYICIYMYMYMYMYIYTGRSGPFPFTPLSNSFSSFSLPLHLSISTSFSPLLSLPRSLALPRSRPPSAPHLPSFARPATFPGWRNSDEGLG